MRQRIDLGAETVEFVRRRMTEIIGEDPENITKIKFMRLRICLTYGCCECQRDVTWALNGTMGLG